MRCTRMTILEYTPVQMNDNAIRDRENKKACPFPIELPLLFDGGGRACGKIGDAKRLRNINAEVRLSHGPAASDSLFHSAGLDLGAR